MANTTQIVRPDPDPTLLTTENLRREISNLKDLIEVRLSENDKAVEIFRAETDKFRTDHLESIKLDNEKLYKLISSELNALSQVTDERFKAVSAQFAERDTRTDQRAGDTKLAVDAAFAAAKEATAEIKTGFTKSIDALQTLITANTKAADDKIGDLKDRITAMEARTQGIGTANQDNRGVIGTIVGVGGFLVALGALVFSRGH